MPETDISSTDLVVKEIARSKKPIFQLFTTWLLKESVLNNEDIDLIEAILSASPFQYDQEYLSKITRALSTLLHGRNVRSRENLVDYCGTITGRYIESDEQFDEDDWSKSSDTTFLLQKLIRKAIKRDDLGFVQALLPLQSYYDSKDSPFTLYL